MSSTREVKLTDLFHMRNFHFDITGKSQHFTVAIVIKENLQCPRWLHCIPYSFYSLNDKFTCFLYLHQPLIQIQKYIIIKFLSLVRITQHLTFWEAIIEVIYIFQVLTVEVKFR